MENRQYFRPTVNEVYTSIIGLQYRCLSADGFDAELMNTESKWILKVTGCQIDDDGKIHWDSSERKLYTAEDFVLKSVMMETLGQFGKKTLYDRGFCFEICDDGNK